LFSSKCAFIVGILQNDRMKRNDANQNFSSFSIIQNININRFAKNIMKVGLCFRVNVLLLLGYYKMTE
jgi:hypothetical protein